MRAPLRANVYLSALFSILTIMMLFGIANAADVNTLKGWHPLQQIAKSSSDHARVDNDGNGIIDSAENAYSCNADGTCEVANLYATGNAGIGVPSPSYKLDVSGDVRWTGTLQGGSVPWARLTTFPAACPAGQYASSVGLTLGCSTPAGSGGDITDVIAGSGLAGGGTSGSVTLNVGQGTGITVAADSVSLNTAGIGSCTDATTNKVYWDSANSRLGCGTDRGTGTVTSVGTGAGLTGGPITISGTVSADTNYLQRRVSGTCLSGNAIRVVNSDGTVTCEPTGSSSGLTGSGTLNYLSKWTGATILGNSIIYDNGNVGIGTTNPINGKLEINAVNTNGLYSASNIGYGVYATSGSTYAIAGLSSGGAGTAGVYGYGYHGVFGASSGSGYGVYGQSVSGYDFYGNGPKSAFMGNVGIGTASPASKLDVQGNISSSNYVKAATGLCIGASCIANWPSGGVTGSGTANYIPKWTGSSALGNSVIYESNGNIGIGTSTPQFKLEVTGSGKAVSPQGWYSQYFRSLGGNFLYLDAGDDNNYEITIDPGTHYVGIGIQNPQAALDMGSGGIRLGGVTHTSWPTLSCTPRYGEGGNSAGVVIATCLSDEMVTGGGCNGDGLCSTQMLVSSMYTVVLAMPQNKYGWRCNFDGCGTSYANAEAIVMCCKIV